MGSQNTPSDRTREYSARRKGRELSREEFTQTEIVVLSKILEVFAD